MCTIKNPTSQTITTIPNSNGLYKIASPIATDTKNMANIASGKMSLSQAHRKLGHISYSAIKHAISQGFIAGIKLDPESKPDFCDACAKAKSTHQLFPKESKSRAEKFGEQVHWDLWGPAIVRTLNGNSYMAACIDDATHESKLYFQDKKSQTFDSYKTNEAYIETQTSHQIKVVHSDQGGEFLSDAMVNHQNQKGTVRELPVHDSPPQNGVSKRGMQTRAEQAQALLISSGLPRFLWEEAMNYSNWLQNHTPACANKGKTLYKLRHKKKPNLAGIQEFSVTAYVKDLKAGKLDAQAKVGKFVGYDTESKGYHIYWPTKRSVTVEWNIVFNSDNVPNIPESAVIQDDAQSEGESQKIIQAPSNNLNSTKNPDDKQRVNDQPPEISSITHPKPQSSNSIAFPSMQETQTEAHTESQDKDQPVNN